jgi:hypothetical protein
MQAAVSGTGFPSDLRIEDGSKWQILAGLYPASEGEHS